MPESKELWSMVWALVLALGVSFVLTPLVKIFAGKVGAIDVPKDGRRVHDHPIPRLGGLAIFVGFILGVTIFAKIDRQLQGILLGAVIVVVVGAIDDIRPLGAWVKLLFQCLAAGVAIYHGVVIEVLSNPIISESLGDYLVMGWLSIPVTLIWIVGITNSVNIIDGLDGLAVGVSAISSVVVLIISVMVSDGNVAIVMAALAGACIGFMPYNLNPAKIFMGDCGSLLLGYTLATVSIIGLFKFYAIVSFLVPCLVLAFPLFDTVFAFFRRILRGQSPMHADRGHLHHRLIDMGMSQKQAVAVLYAVSIVMGMLAVMLSADGGARIILLAVTVVAAVIAVLFISTTTHNVVEEHRKNGNGHAEAQKPAEETENEKN